MILGMKRRSLPKILPRRTTSLALPRARAQLLNRRSPPNLSFKLRKDGKLTPQEHQCCLDNKLCLFCGSTAGHVAKYCPKFSLASAKAQASKSDQDKSTSSGMDSQKD